MAIVKENLKKAFQFSLEVYQGNERASSVRVISLGSEIKPVQLAYDKVGSGTNTFPKPETWTLIVQDGKPIIIWTKEQMHCSCMFYQWEAYSCDHLPAGKGVYRK